MIKRLAVVGFISVSSTLAVLGSISATTYIVRKGDSLSSIAREHHISYKALAHANGLTDKSVLQLGKKLNIPSSSTSASKAPHSVPSPAASVPGRAVALGIVAKSAPLRSAPEASGKKIATLPTGAKIKILQTKWHWHQVKTASGAIGWVGDYLVRTQPLPDAASAHAKTTHLAKAHASSHKSAPRSRISSATTTTPRQYMAHVEKADRLPQAEPARVASANSDDDKGEMAVLRTAMAQRGSRYRYGGVSRGGFDCSGFTRWVYAKHGVSLPHNAAAQSRTGKKVAKSELQPGDLVFFSTRGKRVGHVGVYTGNGKFIHASNPRGGVKIDSLSSSYYGSRFVGARRVK